MYPTPVWKMIREAVETSNSVAMTNAEIQKYIWDRFGSVNEGTIHAQINACCVNSQSRIGMPENRKPRTANDERYDFLFRVGRGLYTKYDPSRHGLWEIAESGGKLFVRRADATLLPGKTSESLEQSGAHTRNEYYRVKQRPDILRPSPDMVRIYLEKWKTLGNYKVQEDALDRLFRKLSPQNRLMEDVLLKVTVLNTFYSTNIFNVAAMARHIHNLHIDERLEQEDETLVTDIASGHGIIYKESGKERHFYSFATKYCSHHRPEVYPIYDSYVEKLLLYWRNEDKFAEFRQEDLRRISEFKKIFTSFQSFYLLQEFTLKEIDQYLWQYGKEKYPKEI